MTELDRYDLFHKSVAGAVVSMEFDEYLRNEGFFRAPASTKYHGAYEGGLFDHSFAVMESLVALTENNNLVWRHPESPYIVGMFHDLCKIDNYIPKPDGDGWEYNPSALDKRHGDKSLMLLAQHIVVDYEEDLCIRYHMGAFTNKEEWRNYTTAIHIFPNVLWTHQADMLAAHVKGV